MQPTMARLATQTRVNPIIPVVVKANVGVD
jgi:hypothetical protein